MTGRPSAALERALARVDKGETRYQAAKAEGIALSTIYRGWKRREDAKAAAAAKRKAKR